MIWFGWLLSTFVWAELSMQLHDATWHFDIDHQEKLTVSSPLIESCSSGYCIKSPHIFWHDSKRPLDIRASFASIDHQAKTLHIEHASVHVLQDWLIHSQTITLCKNEAELELNGLTLAHPQWHLQSPRATLPLRKGNARIQGPWQLRYLGHKP